MTIFDWIAALAGGLLLYVAVGLALGLGIGAMISRADEFEQPDVGDPDATADDGPFVADDGTRWAPFLPPVPPSQRHLPESPLDLQGYQLDAAFYAVVAPSFADYR